MFLRGLPNLCSKMKRPPKVKSAAAAARNSAGATTGTPDFYRISRIAPLPPAIVPSLPSDQLHNANVILLSSQGMKVQSGAALLQSRSSSHDDVHDPLLGRLHIEEAWGDLDIESGESHIGAARRGSLSMVEWDSQLRRQSGRGVPSDQLSEHVSQLPFSDPWEDDGDHTAQQISEPQHSSSADRPLQSANASAPGGLDASSNHSQGASSVGSQNIQLSSADLSYLAHQNRILLKYAQRVEEQLAEANTAKEIDEEADEIDSKVQE